jgi:class 3 adenylate cyclase
VTVRDSAASGFNRFQVHSSPRGIQLQARVGIATGLVVVGDLIGEGSAQEQSVVGETPNLAARLPLAESGAQVPIAGGHREILSASVTEHPTWAHIPLHNVVRARQDRGSNLSSAS